MVRLLSRVVGKSGGFTFYDISIIHLLMRVSHGLYLLKERMLRRKEPGERLTGYIHSL
jgi:hypothetical protein